MFLEHGNFDCLDHYQQKEIRTGLEEAIAAGYDSEQLDAIRCVLEKGINIQPYLNTAYHASSIMEIAIGLKHNIDVRPYADVCYTWRKMREIRLGLEHHLDISQYSNPLYSYWQMREIRLGLEEGLDVSNYKSLMYTAKEMRRRRLILSDAQKILRAFSDWTVISNPDYDIRISPDGIEAYFDWHCKRPVESVQELEVILYKNGIVHGIDYETLENIVKEYHVISEKSKPDLHTLVAKGTEPIPGKDGHYEWFFTRAADRLPHVDKDGCIDFAGIRWFEPVSKGQTLAIYHLATKAIAG